MKGFSVGDEVSLTGVVVSTKTIRGTTNYVLHTGEIQVSFSSKENLLKGEEIEVKGKVSGFFPLIVAPSEINKISSIYENILKKVEDSITLGSFIAENEVTSQLKNTFFSVAKRIKSAKELNRTTLLRFHNDADGIAGAFSLTEIAQMKAFQQNGAIYSQKNVVNDLSFLYHENKPLVILLDFGSGPKNAKSLELLRASGAEIILIDHHPLDRECEKIAHTLLSPWSLDIKEPSRYTAGYLASEIAHLLGVDSERFARIACAGDKSTILEPKQEDIDAALVLDYLATNTYYGNNLNFYRDVLTKDELFSSIRLQAKESIEAAAEKATDRMKKKEKGIFSIFIVPLSGIVTTGEFPNRSKITTAVLEKVKTDKPTAVIGYGDGTIILRANKEAVQNGLNFSDMISSVSESFMGAVLGGGGHAVAAAMRVQPNYEQPIIDALMDALPQ